MAQVTRDPQLQATIDRYLDNLHRAWESVPMDALEWTERDELSQLTYVVNWPVNEDQLRLLAEWSAQGLLTPVQQDRYEALLQLVERHRSLLDQLLAG